MEKLKSFLKKENIEFCENASASSLCSFRVGGTVELLARPKKIDELTALLDLANEYDVRYMIIGKGSNVIFPDGKYKGLIIETGEINKLTAAGNTVTAESGASLFSLATFAEKNSLSGLEFAHGIPGSVGGAVYMNAGAYGGEIKDVLVSCVCYDTAQKRTVELSNADCGFSYRHSIFADNKDLLVLSVTFALSRGNSAEIREKMDDLKARRKEKQPLEYPSAGSSFKRPEGYFAGKLIEDAGLKGKGFGGACVSEKHAGFIINKGGATCADIKNTVAYIKETVKEKFGVELECEFEFISEDV